MQKKYGKFYGVGVGPGDPELITLKGLNVLKSVPVVFVPVSREGKDSYALGIAERYLDFSKQERIDLLFPMKKNQAELIPNWDRAAEKVLEVCGKGMDSAFITEGDPFFFSTFIYLYTRVIKKVPRENITIVPGVTSFCASAAAAEFPLVHGEARLAILPSVYDMDKVEEVLEKFDTVVFMKVNKVLPQLLKKIERLGLKNQLVYVERCGSGEERIIRDPEELKKLDANYLSLMIVKKH